MYQTIEKYPVMAKFEYNWATAEMVKLYLRNTRVQAKHKAYQAASTSPESRSLGCDTAANTDPLEPTGMEVDLESDDDSNED